MGWGRSSPKVRVTELERLAGLAEKAFLEMPEADRQATLAAVDTIAAAITGLKNLPDALVDLLGRIVVKFLLELHLPLPRKPTPRALVGQIISGAPTLLGPHRQRIEGMLE
jgi:hypothetical protein